jgi:hypothetical protein
MKPSQQAATGLAPQSLADQGNPQMEPLFHRKWTDIHK